MWIHAAKILQRMHRNTQESSYNMSTLADRTGRSAYENLSGLPLFLVARDWQNFLHSRIKKNDKKHKFLLSPSTDNRKNPRCNYQNSTSQLLWPQSFPCLFHVLNDSDALFSATVTYALAPRPPSEYSVSSFFLRAEIKTDTLRKCL